MKYAARTDATHHPIVQTFRAHGYSVESTARMGRGFPDIVVARGHWTAIVEIKSPGGTLTERQQDWHELWRGEIFQVDSVGQAERLIRRVFMPAEAALSAALAPRERECQTHRSAHRGRPRPPKPTR